MTDYISAKERLNLMPKKESNLNLLNSIIIIFIGCLAITGMR